MTIAKRANDMQPVHCFRTERLYQTGQKWYFMTREGTEEGPFDARSEALLRLELYLSVMNSGLLSPECELSVLPY